MTIHHIHTIRFDNEQQGELMKMLNLIIHKINKMATDLTALTAAVAKDTEVDQSAITLLQGLKQKLDEAGTDPVALKALSDQLGANSQALADAVVANTPAA